jgi:transcriptional regulator with XRE-family HTH domain
MTESQLDYVGKYLRLRRKHIGMTQVELAKLLEVNQSQICKWERAEYYYVNLEVVAKVAEILGADLNTNFKEQVDAWLHS